MSIQFRTRTIGQELPTTIADSSGSGWCCGFGGGYTKAKCISLGGFFLPNESNDVNCKTISPCKINKLNDSLGGACCYWDKSGDFFIKKCKTVDSKIECDNLHKGLDEGLKYNFYPGSSCVVDGGDIVCNGVKPTREDLDNNCNPDSIDNCFDSKNILGTCCTDTTEEQKSIGCKISTKTECDTGFWSPPYFGKIMSCGGNTYPCYGAMFSGKFLPDDAANANFTTVTTTDNYIQKLPTIGDYYQGGVYVGIFKPGSPLNSTGSVVYGNPIGGPISDNYVARGTGEGLQQGNSWILIADTDDFDLRPYELTTKFIKDDSKNSSTYDGLYNTYKTLSHNSELFNSIKNYKKNGFIDWYIPSQDELAFYFKNIPYNYNSKYYNNLLYEQYMSSTVFFDYFIPNLNEVDLLIYSQLNTKDNYGKVVVSSQYTTMGIRLFRRIYLDAISTKGFSLEQRPNCETCLNDAARRRNEKIKVQRKLVEDLENQILLGIMPDGSPVDCNNQAEFSEVCCWQAAEDGLLNLIEQQIDWTSEGAIALYLELVSLLLGIDLGTLYQLFNITRNPAAFFWYGVFPPTNRPPLPGEAGGWVKVTRKVGGRTTTAWEPSMRNSQSAGKLIDGLNGRNGYVQQLEFREAVARSSVPPDQEELNRIARERRRVWQLFTKRGIPNPGTGTIIYSQPTIKDVSTKRLVVQQFKENLKRVGRGLTTELRRAGVTAGRNLLRNLLLRSPLLLAALGGAALALVYKLLEDYVACCWALEETLKEARERAWGRDDCKCSPSCLDPTSTFCSYCDSASRGCCKGSCSDLECLGAIGMINKDYEQDVFSCCSNGTLCPTPGKPKPKICQNFPNCLPKTDGCQSADDNLITNPLEGKCRPGGPREQDDKPITTAQE